MMNNTTTTLLLLLTSVLGMGVVTVVLGTTQTAEAARNCDTAADGSFTCTGGSGGRFEGEFTTTNGGDGGRITCNADHSECVSQGGSGDRTESMDGCCETLTNVGGSGHRVQGDFGGGDVERNGGEGRHQQGPGGNSGE